MSDDGSVPLEHTEHSKEFEPELLLPILSLDACLDKSIQTDAVIAPANTSSQEDCQLFTLTLQNASIPAGTESQADPKEKLPACRSEEQSPNDLPTKQVQLLAEAIHETQVCNMTCLKNIEEQINGKFDQQHTPRRSSIFRILKIPYKKKWRKELSETNSILPSCTKVDKCSNIFPKANSTTCGAACAVSLNAHAASDVCAARLQSTDASGDACTTTNNARICTSMLQKLAVVSVYSIRYYIRVVNC